jgi:hypothetical protein
MLNLHQPYGQFGIPDKFSTFTSPMVRTPGNQII